MATRAAAQDPQVEKFALSPTPRSWCYLHTELDWPVDVEDVDEAFSTGIPTSFPERRTRVAIGDIITAAADQRPALGHLRRVRAQALAYRRPAAVLNSLAIRRRASAKKGGDTRPGMRAICCPFHLRRGGAPRDRAGTTDESEHGDLPVLRVLADEADTAL